MIEGDRIDEGLEVDVWLAGGERVLGVWVSRERADQFCRDVAEHPDEASILQSLWFGQVFFIRHCQVAGVYMTTDEGCLKIMREQLRCSHQKLLLTPMHNRNDLESSRLAGETQALDLEEAKEALEKRKAKKQVGFERRGEPYEA